jgi:hypothetical protein
MPLRRSAIVASLAGGLVAAGWIARPYAVSAAFVLDVSGLAPRARRLLPVRARPVTRWELVVDTRFGPLAARWYQPATAVRRPFVVFPGVHRGGVDEPRLEAFSERLAATGTPVLSVPLPDLRQFRLTERTTDMIEDATMWLAARRDVAPDGRVGIAAISFAGGLALVAAGRSSLADRVQMVVSLGGHADLPRVMTYLCTGRLPDGTGRPPHDYGVAIILLAAVDRLVPPDQAPALGRAVFAFLDASSAGPRDAPALFAGAERQAQALPEPARQIMRWVLDRNVEALGPKLLPFVEALGGAPSLSPARSPAAAMPVFLLHGADDNVIPSSETTLGAAYLASRGNGRVRSLLTPLVTHASTTNHASLGDAWRLIRFWKELLEEGR